ncbi:MAG: aspartate aminotransferase family protein [Ruminococcaceae bacterium]|nr:aspartate aminotransferase family protein [Oscillospiraceae bacterium]
MTTFEKDNNYIMNTYGRFNVSFCKGKGTKLWDENGKEYLDFGSGIGVTCLGHCDEGWVNAVSKQASQMGHISNLYYNPVMAELAQKLTQLTSMSRVFFCNSGAEANEGAIKLARKYGAQTGRTTIITLKNSFHGRTIATLTATGQDTFHKNFGPFPEGFLYAQANMESLKSVYNDSVCAVMVECIQGEGGVLPLEEGFAKELESFCKEKNILIIADEVQTGVMRTGSFLCSEQYGFNPSIVTMAKGLGGGLPFGAFLCNEELKDIMCKGDHGSTFGANTICCAGALEVISRVTAEDFGEAVKQKGNYIMTKLKEIENVGDIRGKGLMIGFDVKKGDSKEIVAKMIDKGLLCLTAKSAIRLLPALTVSYEEIDTALEIIKSTL